MSTRTRPELGDFVSMHCFKALITGMEDILGPEGTASAMISAGRRRGSTVAEAAGLKGQKPPVETLAKTLNDYLGENGTCLCQIASITQTAEGGFYVKTKETICTAGEPADSTRVCTYTLGAVVGFLESVSGLQLTGSHVESVLKGSATDDFLLKPIG